MKILIMGLPGSGKTALAKALQEKLNCDWFNADVVREQFDDWDFSLEGRIRQSRRMRDLANTCFGDVIVDFVAPLQEMRDIFNPDILIWVDRIEESVYKDTNLLFQIPTNYDIKIPFGLSIDEEVELFLVYKKHLS